MSAEPGSWWSVLYSKSPPVDKLDIIRILDVQLCWQGLLELSLEAESQSSRRYCMLQCAAPSMLSWNSFSNCTTTQHQTIACVSRLNDQLGCRRWQKFRQACQLLQPLKPFSLKCTLGSFSKWLNSWHNATSYGHDVLIHWLPKQDLTQGSTQDCAYLTLEQDTYVMKLNSHDAWSNTLRISCSSSALSLSLSDVLAASLRAFTLASFTAFSKFFSLLVSRSNICRQA